MFTAIKQSTRKTFSKMKSNFTWKRHVSEIKIKIKILVLYVTDT